MEFCGYAEDNLKIILQKGLLLILFMNMTAKENFPILFFAPLKLLNLTIQNKKAQCSKIGKYLPKSRKLELWTLLNQNSESSTESEQPKQTLQISRSSNRSSTEVTSHCNFCYCTIFPILAHCAKESKLTNKYMTNTQFQLTSNWQGLNLWNKLMISK